MKKYLLLISFLLPYALFSITIDSIKTVDSIKNNKCEIGFSFSPDYSYRSLKSDASNQLIKEIRDTLEVPKFGYTAGINLLFHIHKKIVVETGLLFSDKGEKTKKTSFVNVTNDQLPTYYTYKYHYYYLDIPLKVNYYVLMGKLKIYLTAGISGNIFLTQKTTLLEGHDNKDTKRTSFTFNPEFNRFNLAFVAGAGINYKVSKRTDLKVEPIYRRSITPIDNFPIKVYLYSAGLNIGLTYKL